MAMCVVLDTNVLVAALRSQNGAAYRVLSLVGSGAFEHALSVALVFEYEDVIKRPNVGITLPHRVIDDILDFLCSAALRRRIHFLWRPVLPDPGDDLVLEVAVEAQCTSIVTYNVRDFVGSERFGIRVLTPRQFLHAIGSPPGTTPE